MIGQYGVKEVVQLEWLMSELPLPIEVILYPVGMCGAQTSMYS